MKLKLNERNSRTNQVKYSGVDKFSCTNIISDRN